MDRIEDPAARGQASHSSTRADWRSTILAGLANYIDAGSIVAGSAALALWQKEFGLTDTFLGIIGAFSANAISAGVGALIGGRLCDRIGRKRIYQWDLLIYAAGMLVLVFAAQPWMIVLGFVVVGLAVGADIPASWSLIAELAPEGRRARHSGSAQVLWYLGPVVVLLLSAALGSLGVLGARLVFAHLVVVALVLWALRFRMRESALWQRARDTATAAGGPAFTVAAWRTLLRGPNLRGILFLVGMYGVWNLWAGTNGFFFPYILRTVGNTGQGTSVAVQALNFFVAMLSIYFVFMRLADRVNQRTLLLTGAAVQVVGMALLAVFPLTLPVALCYVLLTSIGGGFGQQSFFQLWSAELFPTLLRSTAQGLAFAIVRIGLGLWSFVVPLLVTTGFATLAWILTGFLLLSGVIGFLGAPRNEGRSLVEIERDRAAPGGLPR